MRDKRATPARILARIAARQHDVVTWDQLLSAGLTRSGITRWIAAGHLHRIHRGVYTLGNPNLTREGYFMAAILAVEGSVLSHGSAAVLHKLSSTCPPIVHVTVPGHHGRRKRKGIVVHRSKTLTPADTTIHRGIPVTTVARTLADLGWGKERTRSDLERLFLRICRQHGIPKPEVNVKVGPYEVDFLWRTERLVVEVDGYRYHSSRRAFRADRARDRYLGERGLAVLRFADQELDADRGAVATSVFRRLGKASDPRPRMG
jgi:very-short-patch-repair endonuclease